MRQRILSATLIFAGLLAAGEPAVMSSRRAAKDFALTADPSAAHWKSAPIVSFEQGRFGEKMPGLRTEVRTLWTPGYLYLLFSGQYQGLHMRENPVTDRDTWGLWDYDVAEVFIGSDFKDINVYKEFEVSPQGEWIDLRIDMKPKPPAIDEKWNSGFECKASIDRTAKVWHAAMKIPFASIDSRPIRGGIEYRLNLYRIHWATKAFLAWRPVNQESFHNPAAFGRMKLEP